MTCSAGRGFEPMAFMDVTQLQEPSSLHIAHAVALRLIMLTVGPSTSVFGNLNGQI